MGNTYDALAIIAGVFAWAAMLTALGWRDRLPTWLVFTATMAGVFAAIYVLAVAARSVVDVVVSLGGRL